MANLVLRAKHSTNSFVLCYALIRQTEVKDKATQHHLPKTVVFPKSWPPTENADLLMFLVLTQNIMNADKASVCVFTVCTYT